MHNTQRNFFKRNNLKGFVFGTVTVFLSLLFLLIVGEAVIRMHQYQKYTRKGLSFSGITLDKELGWLPASNYFHQGEKKDGDGVSYSATVTTDKNGFRAFGNIQEEIKKKVFFIGDSYTHALEVSDNKTYYSILKNDLDIEIFAFGAGGYGTLQEYMILEKWIDVVRPDILVIQLCTNDFINNHYELEFRSKWNNNGLRRPYFSEEKIKYKTPKRFPLFRNLANKFSRSLYYILIRIDILIASQSENSIENTIKEKGGEFNFYQESVEITEKLVKKIKTLTPSSTPIYAFCADDWEPSYSELKRISGENGIHFIEGIPQAVKNAEMDGITMRAADKGHWNEKGHQMVADLLHQYFKENW